MESEIYLIPSIGGGGINVKHWGIHNLQNRYTAPSPLFFKQGDPFRKLFYIYIYIYIYMLLVNKCEIKILLFKYEDDYFYHPDHMVNINFPLQVTCNLVLEILHVLILQWSYIPLIYHSLQN